MLFGCGCHAVTLGHDNLLISADYPGCAQRIIEAETGAENALFFNMAEGNVIPDTREIWDSLDTRGYLGGTFKDAEDIGNRLAKAVIHSLKQQPSMTEMFLASRKTDCVMMPNLHDLDDDTASEELAKYQNIIAEYLGEDSLKISPEDLTPLSTLWRDASLKVVEMEMSEAEMRRLMTAVCNYFVRLNKLFNPTQRNPIQMPVQVVCIDKFNFLALPGEILVENAFDWQARNGRMAAESFVIGLANGFMGLSTPQIQLRRAGCAIPVRDPHECHGTRRHRCGPGGGYETGLGNTAILISELQYPRDAGLSWPRRCPAPRRETREGESR